MIPFSINKKTSDEKKPVKHKLNENREYITSYSTKKFESSKSTFSPNSCKSEVPKKKCKLVVMDIKQFKDEDTLSLTLSNEDVARMVTSNYKNFKETEPPSKFKESNFKSKHQSKPKETHACKIGEYCAIIGGKHVGNYGKVTYISADSDAYQISFWNGKDYMIHKSYVKKVSSDAYKDFIVKEAEALKTIKEEAQKQKSRVSEEKVEAPLTLQRGMLMVGLHVRIVSKGYRGGRHDGERVVIEDVYGEDECECLTAGGEHLTGLSSDMLCPERPRAEADRCCLLEGEHKGDLVRVLEVDGGQAEVELLFTAESWTAALSSLCLCDR